MNSNSKSGIISPKEMGVSKIEGDRFDNFCGTNRKLSQMVDKRFWVLKRLSKKR